MGFADIIGTAMVRIKAECGLSDLVAGALPMMIFVWFLLISIPTGVLCGKIGRKNTVLLALFTTVVAMMLPFAASAERFWVYFVSFALIGIGNTMIQAALPALMSNVVAPDQLTSRISLGQFVKALCAAVTPVVAYVAAKQMGNWKYMFLIYGALSLVAGVWLMLSAIPREEATGPKTSFGSCLALLAHPYVLAMTVGIVFSVGADVGFAVAIPEYLKTVFRVDTDAAATGPTVYFIAKMMAAFAGSIVFAHISAAKCFPWSVGVAVVATVGIFFAPSPTVFLVLVFCASFGFANTFGMCMGLAIDRIPAKANEISALMVMAIFGGGLSTFAMGAVQSRFGANGITCVLLACLLYLLGLGFFASRSVVRR
jgi:fucose permease